MSVYHITNTDGRFESRLIKMASVARDQLSGDKKVFVVCRNPNLNHDHSSGIYWVGLNRLSGSSNLRKIYTLIDQFRFFLYVYRLFKENNPTAIHCHTAEQLLFLFLFSRCYGAALVYEPHELESEKNGASPLKRWAIRRIESILIGKCNLVIVVGNEISNEYSRRYRIDPPIVVMNTPPYAKISRTDYLRNKYQIPKEHKVFLYQGGLVSGRGIEFLLRQFENSPGNHIVFLGFGRLLELVSEYSDRFENIHFHEAVSPDQLLSITQSADVGCCFIEPICKSYELAVPNKFFEYIAAGISVLCNPLVELNSIISKYPALATVCSFDQGINFLDLDRKPQTGTEAFLIVREEFLKEYCWERQVLTLRRHLSYIYK